MRSLLLLLVVLTGACNGIGQDASQDPGLGSGSGGFDQGSGSSGGGHGGIEPNCSADADCVLAASACCECPTFALPTDEAPTGCGDVTCPPMSCPQNVEATCQDNTCALRCVPMECDLSCANGFVIDDTGCLACECAPVVNGPDACGSDNPCVEVPADCCGCDQGGADTSVSASQEAPHDSGLGCPTDPLCPGNNTCDPATSPTCIQGRCALLPAGDQTPPANECGLPGDKPCPVMEVCQINAVGPANARGVGVCLAP